MGVELTKRAIDLGIVTTNGPAMLAFYRDVLGFEYLREMPMPGGGRMHQLSCGDSVIKLVVAEKAPAAKSPPGGIQGATGYRYWTISVANLEAVMQQCADAGHQLVVPARDLMPGVRIGIVADPDGNWVEFLSVR